MNDLQNWLISKIPALVPCQLPYINPGTDRLSLKFETRDEIINPLSISVLSVNERNEFTDHKLNFIFSGHPPEFQFIKRLQYTPFYISSLSNESYSLYLIDFYEWSPVTTIYRVFYFHSVKLESEIEMRISSPLKRNVNNIDQNQNWYLSHSGHLKNEVNNEILTIEISAKDAKSRILILSLSENQSRSGELSIKPLLAKLSNLEETVKKNHILQNLKIQDTKKQQLIDELWNRQKGLNPDRKKNRKKSFDSVSDIWNDELCQYMGWMPSKNITKTRIVKILKDSDPFNEFCYQAYFTDSYKDDDIIESLQTWWDQYSLPLYRLKLIRKIKTDFSLIFVIYSLSLQMRLPWNEQLYKMSNYFFLEPQIALLACLYQIAILKTGKDHTVRIIPGFGPIGNIGSVRRGDIEYAYTRFGKTHFTTLSRKNVELLKINKKVILTHNKNLDQLKIAPDLPPVKLARLHTNSISIKIENTVVNIPLLWKKSELILPGCRIRWIFKKDRFQFTCQAKKPGLKLKIDDQLIDFTHSNHTRYYHPIKKSGSEAVLNLYDRLGRSYFMAQNSPKEKINLTGWMQDPYGLFVEKYNLVINSHQIPYISDQSGLVNTFFDVNTTLVKIGIISKKRTENFLLRKITNNTKLKLMTYQHTKSKGTLVIIIEDELKILKKEVENLFLSAIGFMPLIFYKSELKRKISLPFMIYIGENETLSRVREIKGLSKSSILSINYPEGIIHLFKILSDIS